jgi:hypothetical protein
MIRLSETKVLDDYFIDENGVVTDINGVVQKTYLSQGRPKFKNVAVHRILMYTFYGYKKLDIHHIDENKLNNTLKNLVYLTREEHTNIHHKGKKSPFYGQRHSEETKQKLSESHKGINNWTKDLHWFNDGTKNFYCRECPSGCIPGRIKKVV